MRKWYQIFPKNTGLSIYIWLIFCIMPFYFLFKSSPSLDFFTGIIMVILFFVAYRLSFVSETWFVYVWVSIGMIISMYMTLFYGYVYFALFLSFFIGNIKSKAGFISLYVVHLVTTVLTINIGFFIKTDIFVSQLPFMIISIVGISLLPFNIHNRNKQEELEDLLEDATTQLAIIDERQRIARDLHDTLGQKLSLIGMKSDLAAKLVKLDEEQAISEIKDIQTTARTALKEVREMVSHMRSIKVSDEIIRVEQILKAANIKVKIKGNANLVHTSMLVENVLSMCLKEAVTNVVKHSEATQCHIYIKETLVETSIIVKDNGTGIKQRSNALLSHGISGMRERLEFINGKLDITSKNGTKLTVSVPHIISQSKENLE